MRYTEGQIGRVFGLVLDDNDIIPKVIEEFCCEKSINSGLVFFIGGIKTGRIISGPEEDILPIKPIENTVNEVSETIATGIIAQDESGKPILHMHSVVGRKDKTICGCVRLGIEIWLTGEVKILETTNLSLIRKTTPPSNFKLLNVL